MGLMESPDGWTRPRNRRSDDPRLTVDEEASLLILPENRALASRIVEISVAGCRLRMIEPFVVPLGAPAEATFRLCGAPFRLAGTIAWTDGKNRIGVRFGETSPNRMQALVEVLCSIAADQAVRAVKKSAQRHARPSRLPEPSTTASPSKPAGVLSLIPRPADQPASPPVPKPKLTVAERRAESRHTVDTTANILLVKVASRIPGRILNLSLSGCRIRTNEQFPVGIYTRVETEFHLEGLPFRLGGVVQTLQDRQQVGIRFLDMSERKREQLSQLIAEIEQMRGENTVREA